MTTNEVAYQQNVERERSNRENEAIGRGTLKETKRANLERERETRRSNVERERETRRSNLVSEGETVRSNLARENETHRTNVANENLKRQQYKETRRSNIRTEALRAAELQETERNNRVRSDEETRSNKAREYHEETKLAVENPLTFGLLAGVRNIGNSWERYR